MKNSYVLNDIRWKRFGDTYLVTNQYGRYVLLNKKEFSSLIKEDADDKLFHLLEANRIVVTERNQSKIAEEYRKKYSFLFRGTSLHIIVPTLRCNMKCVYCHASSKEPKMSRYDMGIETARKTVEFIFQSPSPSITIEFQGGEPLLNWNAVKFIIEYAKLLNEKHKKEMDITLVTNLTLMTEEKLDYLVKEDIRLCTSLDGPAEVHDWNRRMIGGAGTHQKVAEWIKRIQENQKDGIRERRVNALITLTKKSLQQPEEIVDEYLSRGLDRVHLRFLNNLGFAKEEWKEISYSPEEFIEFWKKAMEYMLKLNKKGTFVKERMATIIMKKITEEEDPYYVDMMSPCGAAIGQLLYNYNGKIYTCDEGRMTGEDVFKIGDVNKDSYKKVLSSNQTCSIITASINDMQICDYCSYKPYCGLCPVTNFAEKGNIIGRVTESDRCKIFKAQFDYIFSKLIKGGKDIEILKSWTKK